MVQLLYNHREPAQPPVEATAPPAPATPCPGPYQRPPRKRTPLCFLPQSRRCALPHGCWKSPVVCSSALAGRTPVEPPSPVKKCRFHVQRQKQGGLQQPRISAPGAPDVWSRQDRAHSFTHGLYIQIQGRAPSLSSQSVGRIQQLPPTSAPSG